MINSMHLFFGAIARTMELVLQVIRVVQVLSLIKLIIAQLSAVVQGTGKH